MPSWNSVYRISFVLIWNRVVRLVLLRKRYGFTSNGMVMSHAVADKDKLWMMRNRD